MKISQVATSLCALALSGCATSTFVNLPTEVTGTLHNSEYTNWALNWCRDGKPAFDLFNLPDFDCVQLGGEIYRSELRNIRSADGTRIQGAIPILIARHAFSVGEAGVGPWYIVIDSTPTEIATATKTQYYARFYDTNGTQCASVTLPEQKCFQADSAHSWEKDEP